MKINKYILALPALALAMVACEETDYKVYDTTQKDSVFFEYYNAREQRDTLVSYNYGFDISDHHEIVIPVTLMGMPKDYDRAVNVKPLADSTDMVEGVHYEITEARIPAGAVEGVVRVNLLRNNDPELLEKEFKLRLIIDENDDLRSVKGSFMKITHSDIRPDKRPDWWIYLYGKWPVYSYETAQLYFEYFYRLAPKANINIYNEIVEAYGDYHVKGQSQKGPWVIYENFIRNYVMIPLYNEHPEIEWLDDPNW